MADGRIYLTWNHLNIDLGQYKNREKLLQKLQEVYSSEKMNTLKNWASQMYPIAHRVEVGDWVVLPSKRINTIHIGKITGEYQYAEERWDSNDVIRELFENYENLSPAIRAEIPLKQIWMLSEEE